MIPARFAPLLFAFILSGLMSFMVSGISTLRATGLGEGFVTRWLLGGWLPSWALAFPAVLIIAPLTRKLVAKLTQAPPRG